MKSWQTKQSSEDTIGYQEVLNWLGVVSELIIPFDDKTDAATEACYLQPLSYRRIGRCHFECAALTGLVRVKCTQGDYAAIPPLLTEVEQLAQQYEYNDHLASLRLTQAHLALDGRGEVISPNTPVAPTTQGEGTLPLRHYQHALIYALRYNRFLLDEVLSGRPQGSPLGSFALWLWHSLA